MSISLKNMKPAPTGAYVCRVNAQHIRPAQERWKTALVVPLVVVEGELSGKQLPIELHFMGGADLQRGERDAGLLAEWAEAVGVTGGNDFTDLVKKLAATTHLCRTEFHVVKVETKKGVEYRLDKVATGSGKPAKAAAPTPDQNRIARDELGRLMFDDEVI